MKMRTFRASTMREAMNQVKQALGPEAVILNSRELRTGRDPLVEITAANDPEPEVSSVTTPIMSVATDDMEANWYMPDPEVLRGMQTEMAEMRRELARLRSQRTVSARSNQQWDHLMEELKELGRVMGAKAQPARGEATGALLNRLVAGGVEHTLARALVTQVCGEWADTAQQTRAAAAAIQEAFTPAPPVWDRDQRTVAAFVGPTGVGKTTTLAKIAAHASWRYGMNVALVAADTYRIAGVEQLQHYADLLGVPCTIATGREELGCAIERYNGKDLVLVDTAGRNPWRDDGLAETDALLCGLPIERHLCVSATVQGSDLSRMVERYGQSGVRSLIVTKVDEARQLGGVLSSVWGTDYQIAHVTTGQEVPGDIETPNPSQLCQAVLG